jgi:hypothetical protein
LPPSDVTLRKAMDEQEHYMEQRQVGTSFYAHRTPHTAQQHNTQSSTTRKAAHSSTHGTGRTLQHARHSSHTTAHTLAWLARIGALDVCGVSSNRGVMCALRVFRMLGCPVERVFPAKEEEVEGTEGGGGVFVVSEPSAATVSAYSALPQVGHTQGHTQGGGGRGCGHMKHTQSAHMWNAVCCVLCAVCCVLCAAGV